MRVPGLGALAALACLVPAAPALAWGASGHRMIGEAAMQGLPVEMPAFLRTRAAVIAVGELSRESDRIKGAGRTTDQDHDPAHFVNLADDGTLPGGMSLSALPTTREDYDTALRAGGASAWKSGYLPYAVIEEQQQLTKHFAYLRLIRIARDHERSPARRAWLDADRARRETLVLETIGRLSHFVGDAAQPLHVTVHYNGWGDYPNPRGFTTARIHSHFEGEFVAANARPAQVRAAMAPVRRLDGPLDAQVAVFITATDAQTAPLYALEKAGGFVGEDPRGAAFVTERLAAGAGMLRDLIVEAWTQSPRVTVGWPAVSIADAAQGKVDAFTSLYGKD